MIPATAHFVWFGQDLPWANVLAIRSASLLGGFSRIILHSDLDPSHTGHGAALTGLRGFEWRELDPGAVFAAVPGGRRGALREVASALSEPAARSNLVRAAILAAEGGVYLDMDTITVSSLAPLRRDAACFCGLERIVLTYAVTRSRSPMVWAPAVLGMAARDLCRRLPGGWRLFRRIERFYPQAANNAVLGCEPGHPFILDLLDRAIATPPGRRTVRYTLGTHLLQQALAGDRAAGVTSYPPEAFYPLGPEVSHHWFRMTRKRPALDAVLSSETRVVHWYASVRTRAIVPLIDAAYVTRHQHEQLFSALAVRVLAASPD